MQVKEENGSYICLKHNQVIQLIALGKEVQPADQMLCFVCIGLNRQPMNQVVGVDQAKEMIREKLTEQDKRQEETINQTLWTLQGLSKKLIEFRYQFLNNIDTIARLIEQWINELYNQIVKHDDIDLMKGLRLLYQEQSQNLINRNSQTYLYKIDTVFNRLFTNDGLIQCYQDLINMNAKYEIPKIQLEQIDEIESPTCEDMQKHQSQPSIDQFISYDLKYVVKQEENCDTIAFNNTGSIMISGADNDIKVWHFFEGKLTLLTVLSSDSDFLQFLRFSKKNQWFISGDQEGQIKCWKQGQSIMEWISNDTEIKHTDGITGIIFTKNEKQLLSCSQDSQIIVWNVKYQSNLIEYKYTLENKHTDSVNGLSLNESETLLVSCSCDQQLILWSKGYDGKWVCISIFMIDMYFVRVCFVDDNIILAQKAGQGYTNVFKVINQQLQERSDLMIELNNQNQENDYANFPTIYNQNEQVIIQKSCQFVYILKKKTNEPFQVAAPPIDCETNDNYGALTEDGEYLVIWNNQAKEFRVYNITYQQQI